MLAQTIESGLCTISNCVAQHSLMFFNILAFLSTVRHMTKIVQQFFSCFYIVILKLVFTGTLCHNKMATVRRILSAIRRPLQLDGALGSGRERAVV